MSVLRRALGVIVAAGLTLALGALSFTPVRVGGGDSAMVRLAWRATPARIRHCRQLTEEELAKIPPHMRRTEECQERTLPYHLSVWLDSAPPETQRVHAAGAREDRPMYVFHESPVLPGPKRIRVRFERDPVPEGVTPPVSQTPALLTLDTVLTLAPRQIALVTYDADLRRLVVEGKEP